MSIITSRRWLTIAISLPLSAAGAAPAVANGPPSSSPIKARTLMAKMDADRDGRISSTEWRLQSMPQANFEELDRDRDGTVTLRELATSPPAGLDASGDGKLSAREMTFGKNAPKVKAGAASERRETSNENE
ncbi:hypothetical protein AB3M93_14610 [Novosphingobium panipatense]|jgi:hypothetical protein